MLRAPRPAGGEAGTCGRLDRVSVLASAAPDLRSTVPIQNTSGILPKINENVETPFSLSFPSHGLLDYETGDVLFNLDFNF